MYNKLNISILNNCIQKKKILSVIMYMHFIKCIQNRVKKIYDKCILFFNKIT